ncbi:MAG: tetratricopeptide repeat protein [Flavobacteriales bacterium]|nr:tetratricopeptide repeat protein [Flavobacteriales bacterium]MCB9174537.1 tetratricopeptide repeat protein [Flavobacteriales bacterium]
MKLQSIIIVVISIALFGCSSSKNTEKSVTQHPKTKKTSTLSEQDKMKYDFMYFNANKERMIGNYQLSAGLFLQCAELDPTQPAAYYELANIFDLTNQTTEAIAYAQKAVSLNDDNYWYRFLYAHLLQKSNRIDEAVKQYQILIQKNPHNPELLYNLAGTQLYSGKYEEALKTYNKLESEIGVNEEISLQKQKIYIKLNNIDKAGEEIQKLIKAFPEETKYQGYLADMYLANNMPDKAFEIYQRILEKDPTDAFSHLALYEYYRNKGEKDKALSELKLVFENPDFNIDTKMQILLSYYADSEKKPELKQDAYDLSRLLIATHPKDAKSYTIYADFLYRDKKNDGAKENYLKAIELDSSKFAIWSQVVFIESEMQDFDGMLIHSKMALELFPNQALFYFFYGVANIQKQKFQEAVDYLTIGKDFVVKNPPLLSQFYANLGDSYYRLKDHKNSDKYYEKALEIEPNNIYVLNNYSYYLSLRNENLERAEKLSAKANEIEPNQPNYEDTYAWILYKQGKYIAAKEWLEKALENGGKSNAVIVEHLGDVHAKLGNIDKALELWNQAKTLGETSEFIDKKIADKQLYE